MHKFLVWLFGLFGFVPRTELEHATTRAAEFETDITKKVEELNHMLGIVTSELDMAKAQLEESKYMEMKILEAENAQVKLENDRIQEEIAKATDYYKEVQTTLSKALHDSNGFKFPGNMAFPGSTSVAAALDKDSNITIRGRTIFPDDVTAQIHKAVSLQEKYSIATSFLIKYGILGTISKQLMQYGGLQYTLAYNGDCTALELYYQVKCVPPETALIIKNDRGEG